jgi:hypothetical protein
MPGRSGDAKKGLITLGLGLLLVGAALGAKLALGKAPGEACEGGLVCRGLPARCVRPEGGGVGYCTRPCEAEPECPRGWRCETATWHATSGAPPQEERVCVRP